VLHAKQLNNQTGTPYIEKHIKIIQNI